MRPATTHTTNPLHAFSAYRFHFNGKETDNEVYGEGNALDFGARTYDSRLGRWLSVDPLAAKYSDLSPYNFAGNCPILFIDIDGQKFVNPYRDKERVGKLEQNVATAQSVYNNLLNNENGNVTRKEIKRAKDALISAQVELAQNEADAQEVDDYLYTLKVTNESEYNKLDNLKDANNNEIDIVINLYGENMNGTNVGETSGLALFSGTYSPTAQTDNNTKRATININLYEFGKGVDLSTQTQYQSGRNYLTFANELGDITYFFENVKDKTSYDKWVNSAASGSTGYKSDPTGAGVKSSEYEANRVADVKNYAKTNLKRGETYNNVKQTIEKR